MRVTPNLDNDRRQYLKNRSNKSGETMSQIASYLVRKGLLSTPEGPAALESAQAELGHDSNNQTELGRQSDTV